MVFQFTPGHLTLGGIERSFGVHWAVYHRQCIIDSMWYIWWLYIFFTQELNKIDQFDLFGSFIFRYFFILEKFSKAKMTVTFSFLYRGLYKFFKVPDCPCASHGK